MALLKREPRKYPIIGISAWKPPNQSPTMAAFLKLISFTARPLHIDTAKASMDRPMARMSISNTLISFCTPLSVKTANGL